jgi:hypothetical protein
MKRTSSPLAMVSVASAAILVVAALSFVAYAVALCVHKRRARRSNPVLVKVGSRSAVVANPLDVHVQLDSDTLEYGATGELPTMPFHGVSKKLEPCGVGAPVLSPGLAQEAGQRAVRSHQQSLSSGDWGALRSGQGRFREGNDMFYDKPVAPPGFPAEFGTGSTSMSGWSQSIGSLSAHHVYTTTRSLSVEQLPASARRNDEDKPEEFVGKARNGSGIGYLTLDRLDPLSEMPAASGEEPEVVTPAKDREPGYRRGVKSHASMSSVVSASDVRLGTPVVWEATPVPLSSLHRTPHVPTLSQGNVVYHHRPCGGGAAVSRSSSDSLHESGVDMSGLSALSPRGHISDRSILSMGDSAASTNTHVYALVPGVCIALCVNMTLID